MTKYARVTKGTKEYDIVNELWTWENNWINHKEELTKFIGCDMHKNLYYTTRDLMLENPPENIKSQFTKSSPPKAKKNSQIYKQWMELVDKLKLKVVHGTEVSFQIGIFWRRKYISSTHVWRDIYFI